MLMHHHHVKINARNVNFFQKDFTFLGSGTIQLQIDMISGGKVFVLIIWLKGSSTL